MLYMAVDDEGCTEIDTDTEFGHVKDGRMRRWRPGEPAGEWRAADAFEVAHAMRRASAVFARPPG
jgi:hypothetical protein